MAEPDDLETRVAALESQVHELSARVQHSEQDAAAARVLAGGADRDVTDLGIRVDANRQAINALGEQTAARFDRLEQRVEDGITEMRGKFDATAAGQERIIELLDTLINDSRGGSDGPSS